MNGRDWKQPLVRSQAFLEECWGELKRVHWATWDETRAATLAVILGVIVVGVYLGLIDSVLSFVFTRVLS